MISVISFLLNFWVIIFTSINDFRRAAVIKDLLDRHVSLSMDEDYLNREKFILEQLNIPSQWLYNSKALLAGNLKQYRIQAECFINGNMWNEAHTVIMRHLAPDDFINGKYNYFAQIA